MDKIIFSFIVTTVAGISTLLGIFPLYLKRTSKDKIINFSLAFSSGVMLSVSIFSLLPEGINLLSDKFNFFQIVLFVLIVSMLGFFIGISSNLLFNKYDNKLYKIGILDTIIIMLHNIPEGILTFSFTVSDTRLGLLLALNIICHNIPEGISIAIPVYYSTNSKKKAFLYTFISGMSELLGAIITYIFLYKYITVKFLAIVLIFTFGIMSYLSLFQLLPNSLKYRNTKRTLVYFILGFIFMYIFH